MIKCTVRLSSITKYNKRDYTCTVRYIMHSSNLRVTRSTINFLSMVMPSGFFLICRKKVPMMNICQSQLKGKVQSEAGLMILICLEFILNYAISHSICEFWKNIMLLILLMQLIIS